MRQHNLHTMQYCAASASKMQNPWFPAVYRRRLYTPYLCIKDAITHLIHLLCMVHLFLYTAGNQGCIAAKMHSKGAVGNRGVKKMQLLPFYTSLLYNFLHTVTLLLLYTAGNQGFCIFDALAAQH